MRGIIHFFNQERGFGAITPSDGSAPIFVHISAVVDGSTVPLKEGEDVEYDSGHDSKRGSIALNVRRLRPRYRGVVESFDKGFGKIQGEGSSGRYFVHHTSILGSGFRKLEVGETVEFSPSKNPRGLQATDVRRMDSRPRLLRYAAIKDNNLEDVVAKLAALAQPEPGKWQYHHTPSSRPYPILRSYILYTFERVLDEAKIAEIVPNSGGRLACFNTGLVTPRQEAIFCLFRGIPASTADDPSWFLEGFFKESDRLLSHFPTRPDLANYFSDPAELLYDMRIDLVVDVDHIVGENIERFPVALRENEFALRGTLDGAIAAAKRRVRRNYKAAIPHFHRGKLQLLLPLCLSSPEKADLALVVARENQVYRASTVLTLDMAYNNARLIARPDTEWLDP